RGVLAQRPDPAGTGGNYRDAPLAWELTAESAERPLTLSPRSPGERLRGKERVHRRWAMIATGATALAALLSQVAPVKLLGGPALAAFLISLKLHYDQSRPPPAWFDRPHLAEKTPAPPEKVLRGTFGVLLALVGVGA